MILLKPTLNKKLFKIIMCGDNSIDLYEVDGMEYNIVGYSINTFIVNKKDIDKNKKILSIFTKRFESESKYIIEKKDIKELSLYEFQTGQVIANGNNLFEVNKNLQINLTKHNIYDRIKEELENLFNLNFVVPVNTKLK